MKKLGPPPDYLRGMETPDITGKLAQSLGSD